MNPRIATRLSAATMALATVLSPTLLRAQTPAEQPLIGPAVAGGLTADQAASRAAATSPEVRARSERTEGARASVAESRAGFVPRLTLDARYTRLSSVPRASLGNIVATAPGVPPGPITSNTPLVSVPLTFPMIRDQYVAHAGLEVPLSDYLRRLPLLHDAARKDLRGAVLLDRAAPLEAAVRGRLAYYEWARAQLQTEVASRALAAATDHLVDVKAAEGAGTASKADRLQAAARVAAAELQLTRARAAAAVAEQQLRTTMHDRDQRPLEIGEDLRATPRPTPLPSVEAGLQQLVNRAVDTRLEARALLASQAAAHSQASAARAAGLPRLSAVANAVYARPNGRVFPAQDRFRGSWDAGLQLAWSPTDLFGTEARHAGGMARTRQLAAERDVLIDTIRTEISRAVEQVRESEAAIATTVRGLDAAEESYRVRRVLFRNGRATSIELSDAEAELSRAQFAAVSARIDRRISEVRLVHALGHDVEAGQ